MRALRTYGAPVVLVAVVGMAFARAVPTNTMVVGIVAAVSIGWAVVVIADTAPFVVGLRASEKGRLVAPRIQVIGSVVLGVVLAVGGLVVGVTAVGSRGLDSGAIPRALDTFLDSDLPAPGIEPTVVIFVLLYAAMVATTWASIRGSTLATIGPPVVGLGAAATLVAPVGVPWLVPVALGALAAGILFVDGRAGTERGAPLVGPPIADRPHLRWARLGVQVGAALVAVAIVALRVTLPDTFDLRAPGGSLPDGLTVAVGAAVFAAGVVVVLVALMVGLPKLIVARRRRIADPAAAVEAAWASVIDALADRGIELDESRTPTESARVAADRLPVGVHFLMAGFGTLIDRLRYEADTVTPDGASQAWGFASAILERLPPSRTARLAPVIRPARALQRLRGTAGVELRSDGWEAILPDSALLTAADAPDDVPDVIVDARIGDGSTGTVFRGVHRPTSTPVAVKVFRYGPNDPGFDRQRFEWEVRVAQGVSGLPHLPEVLAAGITPVTERPYLVSTLYDKGTLLDRVRRGGPMTTAEVVGIGADLAFALDALHQLGVVHADVKPENVFAGDDGWVLGDLGSAWLRASHGPAATITPPYAAPEVWRGAAPTPDADLYSLALTMLFARTGNVPIAGNPPSRHDIEEVFADHPVILNALDPNPRQRPRGVADFARKLRVSIDPAGRGQVGRPNLSTPTVSHTRPSS